MLTQSINKANANLILNISANKNVLLDAFYDLDLQDFRVAMQSLTINFHKIINELIENQLEEALMLFGSDEFIIKHTKTEHVTGYNVPAEGYYESESDDIYDELSEKIKKLELFLDI